MLTEFFTLERRLMFASTALESGILVVTGNPGGDAISVNANNGDLVVDINGETTSFLASDVNQIRVDALAGNDRIEINANKPAELNAGDGRDTVLGSEGNDTINGGAGNDTITGRRGADTANMGDGDDLFVWNPGDGSDIVEGDAGNDLLQFNGSNASEVFDASANGNRLRFFRNLGNIVMDVDNVERVSLDALGGDDQVAINDLASTDVRDVVVDLEGVPGGDEPDNRSDTVFVNGTDQADKITVDRKLGFNTISGLAATVRVARADPTDEIVINALGGDDLVSAEKLKANLLRLVLSGGQGGDTLIGSEGDDLVRGDQGNDRANMGKGNDTFVWDPGDGSDRIDDRSGNDTLIFNGSAGDEIFDASANGSRLRFFRNLGNIVMDVDNVENFNLDALGGADQVTINDLSATDVKSVFVDLEGALESGVGDAAADRIVVNGTSRKDQILIAGNDQGVDVTGLSAAVRIERSEATLDELLVNSLANSDTIDASGLANNAVQLTLDGGKHHDLLLGSAGADVLRGGEGHDTIDGNQGSDTAFLGAHDDTFIWDPGDGSDVVEGDSGLDTLIFNGSAGNEIMALFANGARATFTRNLGNIVMDLDNVERVDVRALGGDDSVTTNDMAGTDVTEAILDGGDGNDTLTGGPGAQTLLGGNGDDEIVSDELDTVDLGADE